MIANMVIGERTTERVILNANTDEGTTENVKHHQNNLSMTEIAKLTQIL